MKLSDKSAYVYITPTVKHHPHVKEVNITSLWAQFFNAALEKYEEPKTIPEKQALYDAAQFVATKACKHYINQIVSLKQFQLGEVSESMSNLLNEG